MAARHPKYYRTKIRASKNVSARASTGVVTVIFNHSDVVEDYVEAVEALGLQRIQVMGRKVVVHNVPRDKATKITQLADEMGGNSSRSSFSASVRASKVPPAAHEAAPEAAAILERMPQIKSVTVKKSSGGRSYLYVVDNRGDDYDIVDVSDLRSLQRKFKSSKRASLRASGARANRSGMSLASLRAGSKSAYEAANIIGNIEKWLAQAKKDLKEAATDEVAVSDVADDLSRKLKNAVKALDSIA